MLDNLTDLTQRLNMAIQGIALSMVRAAEIIRQTWPMVHRYGDYVVVQPATQKTHRPTRNHPQRRRRRRRNRSHL